jgi:hypothetical protein
MPLNNPQRVRSDGRHTGRARCRYRRAAAVLEEVARPAADARLAHRLEAAPHDLVADPDSSGGDWVWGLFYLWRGCLPDAEVAFYFSAVTYTTLG